MVAGPAPVRIEFSNDQSGNFPSSSSSYYLGTSRSRSRTRPEERIEQPSTLATVSAMASSMTSSFLGLIGLSSPSRPRSRQSNVQTSPSLPDVSPIGQHHHQSEAFESLPSNPTPPNVQEAIIDPASWEPVYHDYDISYGDHDYSTGYEDNDYNAGYSGFPEGRVHFIQMNDDPSNQVLDAPIVDPATGTLLVFSILIFFNSSLQSCY